VASVRRYRSLRFTKLLLDHDRLAWRDHDLRKQGERKARRTTIIGASLPLSHNGANVR
jgi:hypothetical protein